MSNTINTPVHAGYDDASRHGASGGNKVGKYVKELLDKNGIAGNVEIRRDGEGRIVVLNDHKQKAQIEDLLNKDSRLASMIEQPSTDVKEIDSKETTESTGKYCENSHGDSAYISDTAQEAYYKNKSNYLGVVEMADTTLTMEEYYQFRLNNPEGRTAEDRQADLQVNWKSFSNFGQNVDTKFDMNNTGAMVFDHSLGTHVALRDLKLEEQVIPGKSANIQEKEVMAAASLAQKKAYEQLQSAMKVSGIGLKSGEKVNFTMDENGSIKVNPKTSGDRNVASKIEQIIKDDPKLNASIRDYLHVSMTSTTAATTPADMRMHVDTVLKEYTGKGFDDLEWDASGNLVIPAGFEAAVEEWGGAGGLTSMVGHLKSLQGSEGDAIFKKEFTFSVTASGIRSDDMKRRAGSSLFDSEKMWDNKVVYTDEPMLDVRGNQIGLKFEWEKDNIAEEYDGMRKMQSLIQDSGTSVFIGVNGGYAIDANGARQDLPYQSENYTETAKFLIEDYLIDQGIEDDISNYALKINKKGSYEVVILKRL